MPPRTRISAPAAVEAAPLPADLVEGLRRLKLGTIRRQGADVLGTAKIQRWTPEEVLRTLVNAEIAAHDASNQANRLKAAAFPVTKTVDEFKVAASSVPQPTFDYLAALQWIPATHNLCLVGPAGTGNHPPADRARARRGRSRLQGGR